MSVTVMSRKDAISYYHKPHEKEIFGMSIQKYIIHLVDGGSITVGEDYDLPFEEGLVAEYSAAGMNDVLELGTFYVPKRNILCIEAGDVM